MCHCSRTVSCLPWRISGWGGQVAGDGGRGEAPREAEPGADRFSELVAARATELERGGMDAYAALLAAQTEVLKRHPEIEAAISAALAPDDDV